MSKHVFSMKLSELPDDILHEIFKRVSSVEDAVRVPTVCKLWKSVSTHEREGSKPFGPWLMLAKLQNDKLKTKRRRRAKGIRECYSLTTNKLFSLQLPELQGRRGWGTPHGWLLTLGRDLQIGLFHPFTRTIISLPPQPNFTHGGGVYEDSHHVCEVFITRVALSANPSSHSSRPLIAMVVYGGAREVAFASPGDVCWTHVDTRVAIEDVIFFMGNFFCLDGDGILYAYDIDTLQPSALPIAASPKGLRFGDSNFYLVEISGRLYFINREFKGCEEPGLDAKDISTLRTETLNFSAYVFDFHHKKWTNKVKDLNGHAVLLGNNTTCAISTIDHPELSPDCIYFTDDQCDFYSKNGCYNDMGVYDFKKKTMMEPFYTIKQWASKFSRPFFFIPTII